MCVKIFNGFSNTKHVTSFFVNMNNRCVKWRLRPTYCELDGPNQMFSNILEELSS